MRTLIALACVVCFLSVAETSHSGSSISTSIRIVRHHPQQTIVGQGVWVFADIEPDSGESSGTITFTDGGSQCVAVLPAKHCLFRPQAAGESDLIAVYSGNPAHLPSTSSPRRHVAEHAALPSRVSVPDTFQAFGPIFSQANSTSSSRALSADGSTIAFTSSASNLDAGTPIGSNPPSRPSNLFIRERASELITLETVGPDGLAGNASTYSAALSADGRYLAFSSAASNLVTDDVNGFTDVFVRDRKTGVTTLVSSSSVGAQGNGASHVPALSADGRYVTFYSAASNLVAGDSNGVRDVIRLDQLTGERVRVSIGHGGAEADGDSTIPASSGDATRIAFLSEATNLVAGDDNGVADVFVHDFATGVTTRVSVSSNGVQADGPSFATAMSADGRFVAYSSAAANLVTGDTNQVTDVFVRDLVDHTTLRVSLASNGAQGTADSGGPTLSGAGRYTLFTSLALLAPRGQSNVYAAFSHDRVKGIVERVSLTDSGSPFGGHSFASALSSDGRWVAFTTEGSMPPIDVVNSRPDAYVRDRADGTTALASAAVNGTQSNRDSYSTVPSSGGRFVSYDSDATNLVAGDTNDARDVFVFDRETSTTERVSVGAGGTQPDVDSFPAGMSGDGRFVAFTTRAALVPGDTNGGDDMFVRDRQLGTTFRVSVATGGAQVQWATGSAVSVDGRWAVFTSGASNVVPGDTNFDDDVFVHDRQTGETTRVSVASDGTQGMLSAGYYGVAVSSTGRYVAFSSMAANLVLGDTNGKRDIFLRDRNAGTTERISVPDAGGEADDHSWRASVSGDGRFVAFESSASNLVAGGSALGADVFIRDRLLSRTLRLAIARDGGVADSSSFEPVLSADGRFASFQSDASNLVDGDTNGQWDVFVRDLVLGTTQRASVRRNGEQQSASMGSAQISPDGCYVSFSTFSEDLAAGDTNGYRDIYLATADPTAPGRMFGDGFETLTSPDCSGAR